jgi:hypothetical protein
MAGRLEKHGVLTLAELARRGDEIGQLCGLKLGPKMKLEKLLERLTARGAADSVEEMPPQPVLPPMQAAPEAPSELLSAELQAVML